MIFSNPENVKGKAVRPLSTGRRRKIEGKKWILDNSYLSIRITRILKKKKELLQYWAALGVLYGFALFWGDSS